MLGNVLSNFTGIISFNPQYILKERQPQPLNEAVLNSKHTHVPQKKLQILILLHCKVYTVTETLHVWVEFIFIYYMRNRESTLKY